MAAATLLEVVTALRDAAWPLLLAVVIWRLFPTLKRLLESRGFSLKLGQFEFTAQEWSEDVVRATADTHRSIGALENEVAALKIAATASGHDQRPAPSARREIHNILWVDDLPSAARYEAVQLEALGARVTQVSTMPRALELLASQTFDVVVTNVGRNEEGGYDPDAGAKLARAIRKRDARQPVVVYRPGGVPDSTSLMASGVDAIVESPSALYAFFETVGRAPSAVHDLPPSV